MHLARGKKGGLGKCEMFQTGGELRAPSTTLSFDQKTYLCNFGCDFESVCTREIVTHFVEKHTRVELELWGINHELLVHNL